MKRLEIIYKNGGPEKIELEAKNEVVEEQPVLEAQVNDVVEETVVEEGTPQDIVIETDEEEESKGDS